METIVRECNYNDGDAFDVADQILTDLSESESAQQYDAQHPRKAKSVVFRMFGPFFGR